jgi:poly(3-hydroxybutyrate) depolymerase
VLLASGCSGPDSSGPDRVGPDNGSGSALTGGSSGTATGGTQAGGASAAAGGSSGSIGLGGGGGASGATSSTGGDGPSSSGCGMPAETGVFQEEITAFGLPRSYHLSVPNGYDPDVPQRLVFGYHGSNYTGERMRQYLQLEEPPLVEGSIFVYPDGIALENSPDHIAWELDDDGRDLVFFDELLAHLKSRFCIDESRVFVNGQSYGGLMTNAVGCYRGEVLRAIAVVAGSGPRANECPGEVAVWITHGMDDDSVAFSRGEASRDFWASENNCSDMTVQGDPEQCQNYTGCDEGFPVIWCPHDNDGGHQHPSFGREAVRQFLASF